jgi:hypothetical protein
MIRARIGRRLRLRIHTLLRLLREQRLLALAHGRVLPQLTHSPARRVEPHRSHRSISEPRCWRSGRIRARLGDRRT